MKASRLMGWVFVGALFLSTNVIFAQEIKPGLENGSEAPATKLTGFDKDKKALEAADIRKVESEGQRYTILEFFRMSCFGCIKNMALHVPEILDKLKGKAAFKFVALRLPRIFENVREFEMSLDAFFKMAPKDLFDEGSLTEAEVKLLRKELPKVTVLKDVDLVASKAYKVRFTPTTYIVDNKTGKIVYGHVGALGGDKGKEEKKKIYKLILGE